MDTFYTQLKRALETAEGDIWTETVLEGEYRGEKRLLTSEPDEKKDSPRVYCERVSRTPRRSCFDAHHPAGEDAGLCRDGH